MRACPLRWALSALVSGIVLALSAFSADAHLRITEIMVENGLSDPGPTGEFPSWIEFFNEGSEPLALPQYTLSDQRKGSRRWTFPTGEVPPRTFFILYLRPPETASPSPNEMGFRGRHGRPRAPHLSAVLPFQLKEKGDSLFLFAQDNPTPLQELEFPRQRVDVSFGFPNAGRPSSHSAEGLAAPLRTPTPGEPNSLALEGFVRPVHFSREHGYPDAPFSLSLDTTTEHALIRYTLDGSEPTPYSGEEYTGPITISSTTTMRARAFRTGYHPSSVATRTYLFLDDVIRQSPQGEPPPGWPDRWANRQVLDYGMDPDIVSGEHTPEEVKAALRSLPALSLVTSIDNLFHSETGIYANPQNKGRSWERPASFELLDPGGQRTFQIDAGLRVRGAWSRRPENPKHALRLIFRKAYGSGKLNFPLFEDEGVQRFDHIDLRTSLNHSWVDQASPRNTLLRDIFCRDTQRDMGQPYTRSRFYHLFLNGHYWGVYMTQERAVGAFAASYHGGDPEDYDVVKSRGELADGTWDAHRDYYDLAMQGFHDNEHYFRAQGLNPDGTPNPAFPKYLDVDNVIDYMILTYYSANQDGPGGRFTNFPNNFYAFFNRKNPDGWKYFAHDMEHTFDVGGPGIEIRRRNIPWRYFNVHWLHERLIENPLYLQRFQERVSLHFFGEGALTTTKALERFDARKEEIHQAMIAHAARWGDAGRGRANRPYTRRTWTNAVRNLRTFIAERNESLLNEFIRLGWYQGVKPPEIIDTGQHLFLTAEKGTLFYTLDGSDPMRQGTPTPEARIAEPPHLERHTLVHEDTTIKAWPATHGTFDAEWHQSQFDDSEWQQGLPGLGFDDDQDYFNMRLIRFDVTETMRGRTNSVYIRAPFEVVSLDDWNYIDLEMRCDDGFAAFLNGQRVASSGAPRDLAWNAISEDKPSDVNAATFTRYRLSRQALQALRPGTNVLAIHGLNVGLDSSDFLITPKLTATALSGGTPLPREARIATRALIGDDWSPLTVWP